MARWVVLSAKRVASRCKRRGARFVDGVETTAKVTTFVLLVDCAIFLMGCGDENSDVHFRDTTGEGFVQSCDDECSVRGDGPIACGPDASVIGSRFISVCTGNNGAVYTENCRPVQCSDAADCPPFGDYEYACRSGFCEDPAWNREGWGTYVDVLARCLAGVSRTALCKNDPFDDVQHDSIDIAVAGCGGDVTDDHRLCDALPAECE
jgi:hypothetical protein